MSELASPVISVDKHPPTGRAKVSVTFEMTEEERTGLIERITDADTPLVSREETIEALGFEPEEG